MMKINKEIILSIVISIISLGVYYYLFGCADRKMVFLYGHLGLKPFDSATIGRYWMAGLVLSGFLTIFYLIIQLVTKFVLKSAILSWGKIVQFSVLPLIIGVVFMLTNLGEPKLTFLIAISSALALTFGMATGFSVIDDLVKDYRQTIVYLLFSLGLVPLLLLFRVLELPGKGIVTLFPAVSVILISIAGGFVWLLIAFRIFKHKRPGFTSVIKGTLAIGYIGLPLMHYLIATPKGFPYITSSDNFFPDHLVIRIANWILLIFVVVSADKLTRRKIHGD